MVKLLQNLNEKKLKSTKKRVEWNTIIKREMKKFNKKDKFQNDSSKKRMRKSKK